MTGQRSSQRLRLLLWQHEEGRRRARQMGRSGLDLPTKRPFNWRQIVRTETDVMGGMASLKISRHEPHGALPSSRVRLTDEIMPS